jgi:hypothetical protein
VEIDNASTGLLRDRLISVNCSSCSLYVELASVSCPPVLRTESEKEIDVSAGLPRAQ